MKRKGRYTKHSLVSQAKFKLKTWHRSWKKLSWKKKTLIIVGPIAAFLIITPIVTYLYFYNDIRDQERLLNRNNTGVVIYDKDDEVIYSTGRAEHRELVELDDISDWTEQALIAAEDKNFYEHDGFSALGVMRAMYTNVLAMEVTGGGSTLTQQLAKNTLLSSRQTFLRKYQELTISMAIEQRYSKDEILTMYLNSVFFGGNVFGIDEAAQYYYGEDPSQLDIAQSAMLIGILPAPNAYSPITGNMQYAKERQEYVLGRMLDEGYITKQQHSDALETKLTYAEHEAETGAAPHFTQMVMSQLGEKYGEERVQRSGYQVKTTLDLDLQQSAQEAIDNNMPHIQANGGSNAALVAVDAQTGGIRALIGSADYGNDEFGQVNMATTPRQPGSSFKPIYYADAFARGTISPSTIIEDKKTNFGGYTPQNATRQFYGDVTARRALAWSLNIPAVKVMRDNGGVDRTVQVARSLGISTLDDDASYGLSLALGSAEIPLTEMTNAFATFANSGQHTALIAISEVRNKYGKSIYREDSSKQQVLSSEGAYMLSDVLSDRSARSTMFGSSLDVIGTDYQLKDVAVKTGTTDQARDAWTIGYTPQIAIGVWVGNNDNQPMMSGGSDMAGPIWRQAMGAAIGSEQPKFVQPAGVIRQTVCIGDRRVTDLFLIDQAPPACAEPEPEPEEESEPCQVEGLQALEADDPDCVEPEQCDIPGKETLLLDDPECTEQPAEPPVDDGDGGDGDPGDDNGDDNGGGPELPGLPGNGGSDTSSLSRQLVA